ncbi:hypothetical protein EZS27_017959 [termite gut metagenome]|uniref:site-specific DNA-methyltransferase (adenine-specific) n=1 Tax=termite gut metagenome TaxID=433724 RepID=A0A5J4RJY4_9ZZZZ
MDKDASAIDIARLRLWLSLVVDEEDFDDIEALPNLDYKIVHGNSLIGLPETVMRDLNLEKELENLKGTFFAENNEIRKKELRKEINKKIIDLLDSVESFAGYKIDFDFKFFFSEVWREKGGFDIVIGNPPYDVYEGERSDEIPIIKKNQIYSIAGSGKLNAYKLFMAKSRTLLNQGGIFNQIFQNSFLGDNSAKLLRKYFLAEQQIIKIDSFPERDDLNKRVFKSAKMSVCVLFSRNIKKIEYSFDLNIWAERWMENSITAQFINREILLFDKESFVIPSVSQIEKNILSVFSNYQRFGNKFTCYQGEINLSTNKSIIIEDADVNTMPLLKGAGVQKWFLPEKMSQGKIEYLLYKSYLMETKGEKTTHFKYPRIVMQGITGVDEKYRIKATIVGSGVFCGHSTNYISLKGIQESEAYYFTAILNSEFSNWFFKKFSTNSNVNSYEIHNLPYLDFTEKYTPIQIVASYLLNKKKILSDIVFIFYEQLLDACAYELYFPKEVHAANKSIIEHLQDLKPINDSMTDDQKLSIINSEFVRLYDPYHPVRFAVETMDSIEEIRIIKEALQK